MRVFNPTARMMSNKTILHFKRDYFALSLFIAISLVSIIGIPLFIYFYDFTRLDWALFGILYVITGLGITVGYHRLLSHRSFDCPAFVRIAFLTAGGWAMENSALKWCSDHVRHHAKVDQEEDPYNAKKGFWHSHLLWIFSKSPYAEEKYLAPFRKDKWVMWQHKYYVPIVVSGFLLPALIGYIDRGFVGLVGAFLLAGVLRTFLVLNSTFCINSICHMWGDQPYSEQNSSRNSWWISLVTFGEGYHNYHHAYPRDYRNGPAWYNFDPSKWLIFCLSLIRLAKPSSNL